MKILEIRWHHELDSGRRGAGGPSRRRGGDRRGRLPDTDFEPWGGQVDYCEGAHLYWENGKFTRGELLRVPR